jgi:hypothetical protein
VASRTRGEDSLLGWGFLATFRESRLARETRGEEVEGENEMRHQPRQLLEKTSSGTGDPVGRSFVLDGVYAESLLDGSHSWRERMLVLCLVL